MSNKYKTFQLGRDYISRFFIGKTIIHEGFEYVVKSAKIDADWDCTWIEFTDTNDQVFKISPSDNDFFVKIK